MSVFEDSDVKSILRTHRQVDSWFVSCYSMNLYRGCFHNCAYCDGRDEKYRVEGDFGRDVVVKTGALELLAKELNPASRRRGFGKSYFMVGGGVNDGYQPLEHRYRLSRGALELLFKYGHAAFVLSRSLFVREDLDLIKRIHAKNRAILGVSFSTVDPAVARHFEPSVPSPAQRLETLSVFKRNGVPCVMFLMPVLPFLSDSPSQIEAALASAKEAGADYVTFGSLTLKRGRQSEHFLEVLRAFDPALVPRYRELYDCLPDSAQARSGGARASYLAALDRRFQEAAAKVKIPVRMPRRLFEGLLAQNDYVGVILEHLAYFHALQGKRSGYSLAARSIVSLEESLGEVLDPRSLLSGLAGMTPAIAALVQEILDTGTCQAYERAVASYQD